MQERHKNHIESLNKRSEGKPTENNKRRKPQESTSLYDLDMTSRIRPLSCNGSIQSAFKNLPFSKPATKKQEAKWVKRPRQGAAYKYKSCSLQAFQPISLWLCRLNTDTTDPFSRFHVSWVAFFICILVCC